MQKAAWLLIFILPLWLLGCSHPAMQIQTFTPILDRPELKLIQLHNQDFIELTRGDFRVTTGLYSYNNIIALSIEIYNHSATELGTAEYSITLTDGRDHKVIHLMTRQDVIATRAKLAGSKSAAIQDQIIQTSIDTVMNTVNAPTKERMLAVIDLGIAQYFSFRPVFPHEQRSGFLCFVPDFQLEYPLIVKVAIRENTYQFKYSRSENND